VSEVEQVVAEKKPKRNPASDAALAEYNRQRKEKCDLRAAGVPEPEEEYGDPDPVEMRRAAWWAAKHKLGDRAPNRLADKMLEFASKSPGTFLRQVLMPLMPADKSEPERTEENQAGDFLRLCDELLDQIGVKKGVTNG
jgi:hypothetical protein